MAPKRGTESLVLYTPSPEDLAKAKQILESCDAKAVRAKMASMVGFIQRNPDVAGHDKVKDSRDETRREYLLKYMAFQLEKGQKTTKHCKTAGDSASKDLTKSWSTEFEMRRDYGDERVSHWLSENALKPRPDRYTGSTERRFLEWQLKSDTYTNSETWQQQTTIEVDQNMKLEDISNIDGLYPVEDEGAPPPQQSSSVASASHGGVLVKKEQEKEGDDKAAQQPEAPEKKQEINAQKDSAQDHKAIAEMAVKLEIDALMAAPGIKLTELQDKSKKIKCMIGKAKDKEFSGEFVESLRKLSTRLDSRLRIVEKIAMGEKPDQTKMPALMQSLAEIDAAVQKHDETGRRCFNIQLTLHVPKNPSKATAATKVAPKSVPKMGSHRQRMIRRRRRRRVPHHDAYA